MATLKEVAASQKIVTNVALDAALTELKNYIDTQDAAKGSSADGAIKAVSDRLDTLIGAADGDLDKVINTFNEVKAFLADYDEDDTLKKLVDAAVSSATTAASTAETNAKSYTDTEVGKEKTRAEGAEGALSDRVTTIENVSVMTAAEAKTLCDGVLNPSAED